MKSLTKKILKWILLILSIPVFYFIVSLALSSIAIINTNQRSTDNETIYLNTNGVHLDIIIPLENIDISLLKGLSLATNPTHLSFGWGDENFYINTPTWDDLTFNNAFKALFLKSSTLMHVTQYQKQQNSWTEVKLTPKELQKLNKLVAQSFHLDNNSNKVILPNAGYFKNDDFYRANGSYSCLKTCNTWANSIFKESGLKACYWTPFDFGLINKYKPD